MRNQVQETGIETEDDRVEPVGDLVVTNVDSENDRVEPVREAKVEIVNEQKVVLENAVANEGAENFQVPPILEIAVAQEGTENFQVPPGTAMANKGTRKEKRCVPGPRSSKRPCLRVSGDSPPKNTRRGARGAEDQSVAKHA